MRRSHLLIIGILIQQFDRRQRIRQEFIPQSGIFVKEFIPYVF